VSATPPPAVAFRDRASLDDITRTPGVVVPDGVMPGDRMLLFVSTARNATATIPAGWSLLRSVMDGTDLETWVFTRTAVTGTAGTRVQTTLDATSKVSLTLLAYAGAGAPTAASAVESRSVTGHRAPSATVTTAGSSVVGYWVDKTSTVHGWTLPTGLVGRAMQSGVAGTGILTSAAGDASNVAAGTWPATTATAGTASTKAIAWTVVLPPA